MSPSVPGLAAIGSERLSDWIGLPSQMPDRSGTEFGFLASFEQPETNAAIPNTQNAACQNRFLMCHRFPPHLRLFQLRAVCFNQLDHAPHISAFPRRIESHLDGVPCREALAVPSVIHQHRRRAFLKQPMPQQTLLVVGVHCDLHVWIDPKKLRHRPVYRYLLRHVVERCAAVVCEQRYSRECSDDENTGQQSPSLTLAVHWHPPRAPEPA